MNPFKFGMVGSTDAHTSLSAVEEDNFFGKHSGVEPEPHRWEHVVIEAPDPKFNVNGWQQAAAGYAGVWATENTREAIFDAMKRKETYATTGPRMIGALLRRLGLHARTTPSRACRPASATPRACRWAATCASAPGGKAPTFLVAAMKDPYSGNLDRIQIVKGWLDAGRQDRTRRSTTSSGAAIASPARTASCRRSATRSTSPKATWKNTIGAPELITVWTDPDFDAEAAGLLLRPRHRDPDAALDRLRGAALRRQDVGRRSDDDAGARLHLADLVQPDIAGRTISRRDDH